MSSATILAIGTELAQGQITNRNAVWISERLTELGFEVIAHLTVPDERDIIADALDLGAARGDLLVVTGGLGPTSDDFTRDVLADWSGHPLEFSAPAWEKVNRRLTERGIEVASSNRQQCFFPKGSTRLENLEGTADGFRFSRTSDGGDRTEVLVLPGPPSEGKHLWDRAVDAWLRQTFPTRLDTRLERWHCLGKSESALGEIVEAAVAGFDVKTGYRASMPYIEVKVWIPINLSRDRELVLLTTLNAALEPYCVARNDETLIEKFAALAQTRTDERGLTFLDLGTGGRLSERLFDFFRSPKGHSLRARSEVLARVSRENDESATNFPEKANEWLFVVFPSGEALVVGPNGNRSRTLPNPYPNSALADRLAGFRAEITLKVWGELLVELAR